LKVTEPSSIKAPPGGRQYISKVENCRNQMRKQNVKCGFQNL